MRLLSEGSSFSYEEGRDHKPFLSSLSSSTEPLEPAFTDS